MRVREPSYSPLRPCKQTTPGSMLKVLSRMETSLCSSFLLVRPSYSNAHFPVLSQIPRPRKIRQRGFREPTLRVPRTAYQNLLNPQEPPSIGTPATYRFSHIPVFPFSSSIFLLASVFPIPSPGTFSPASFAITAIYPCCLPVALSAPVAHVSGSWIGWPAAASGFFVCLFLSSSIFCEASPLLTLEGSMSTPFEVASVDRKDFCFSVGASAPVVQVSGWSSWDDMFESRGQEFLGKAKADEMLNSSF